MSLFKNIMNLKYHKVIVFVFLLITGIPIISGTIVNYTLFLMLLISIFILYVQNKSRVSIKNNPYIIWVILLLIVYFLSVLWTIDANHALGRFNRILLISIFCVYLTFLIQSTKEFHSILKIFIFTRVLMALYIITILDFSTLGEMRVGADNLGEEWNANSIGMNLSLAVFSIYFLIKVDSIKRKRIYSYYLPIMLLFTSLVFLTGSRKSLFILIFSIGLFTLINQERFKLIRILTIFSIIIGLVYLSIHVPLLYNVIGSRIEGLFVGFTGQGVADASTRKRNIMIDSGIQFFLEKPILGHGLDSYRHLLFSKIGDFRYSHNNYVELLVGVGIVGTIIYYFGILIILFKLWNPKNLYMTYASTLIITILIIDYGLVSYTSYLIPVFIVLSFITLRFNKLNNLKAGPT